MSEKLELTDFMPDFMLGDQNFHWINLSNQAMGKAIIVLFYPDHSKPSAARQVRSFAKLHTQLSEVAHIFAITNATQSENAAFARENGIAFPLLFDEKRSAAQAYGVSHNLKDSADPLEVGAFTSFVAGPNRRLIKITSGGTDDDHACDILQFLETRPPAESAVELRPYAPLIYVPDVFEPAFCQSLIATYETGETRESGVFRTQRDGSAKEIQDSEVKLRRDHFIVDPALNNEIQRRIGRRILPEVWRATHYPITRFEEFKVVCYDADSGGYFRPHRDNIAKTSAHRRFAVTLNLNVGDYEGGHLRFPEYGPQLYRPDTGDAVVFSCSLLHEALPVTKGRRFVLLAFLFGQDSQRQ